MTIKADHEYICWEPVYKQDPGKGYYHDNDRWPHFESQAKCEQDIAEIVSDENAKPGELIAAKCFDGPCVVIVCDECGDEFDYEGDWGMHFDPADPMSVPITDCDWTIEERDGQPDKHYCPDCLGSWCDDCGELHHDDCPTAVAS